MFTYSTANKEIISLLNKDWLSGFEIKRIDRIIPYCDEELRWRFAENLINSNPEESWPLLQMLACDSDCMVRAEACQSLGENSSKEAFNLLLKISLNDTDEIVRSYAIVSLGMVINAQTSPMIQDAINSLTKMKERDCSSRIQLALCETLYRVIPDEVYLKEIVSCLDNPDYTIRCSALNHLGEIVTSQNKEYIREHIMRLQRVENTQAVLSTISRLKEKLERQGDGFYDPIRRQRDGSFV